MNMIMSALPGNSRRKAPGVAPTNRLALCFIAAFIISAFVMRAAHAQSADARGEARVAIIADLASPSSQDEISIRIMNNRDQQVLEDIVAALSGKLSSAPSDVRFVKGDEDFPDDKSAAVEFKSAIVPRGAGYLPIAPFIEAFAPHAKRLRIAYVVKGVFDYRGQIEPYEDKDISFTVNATKNPSEPLAFYDVDVNIKNPTLTTVDLPRYQEQAQPKRVSPWLLAVGVGLIILAVGLLVAFALPRRNTADAEAQPLAEDGTSKGDSHD